ncbi:cobyric acid synthase [Paenactinomyces guangxiensis]|uniref:Cobyric acid synthase n=1 Tax=Paenactinomyces guangxiensis TaxID=1490290 RepID=A0A7W1WRC9_9BACL|nr:cobyric acid synthase [Paenactinomyces guangxiensis]MBA4494646.1 cobyric acid synthase [Paenactinomyces guangxiensis]MBH8591730.1 cobyric acid synthase [Paenactinomyces guangxiensis]
MKAIMLQGTASDVGKSVLCTALCRYFLEEGYRVAPFKSQNMSLNSYVTPDGGEIGRAQGVQAEAAGIEATTDMNPILLKPKGDMIAEVIVHGRHFADMEAGSYRRNVLEKILEPVQQSLDRLAQTYQVLVIEGAGSPAEINLKDRDIANMRIAHMAEAPVLLVADIDRGGVFASIVGTLELLEPEERARVKGLIINKFRGSKELLQPGIEWLEERTGLPVLGVLPYIEISVDPEDSMSLENLQLKKVNKTNVQLDIAIIRFPRISNFTDFLPLFNRDDLLVRYVKSVSELGQPDVIILPGTKNTMDDLSWLKEKGMAEEILHLKQNGTFVVGICGGYQMLGRKLFDPDHVESAQQEQDGLGLLKMQTRFMPGKKTVRIEANPLVDWAGADRLEGYEIHLGRTQRDPTLLPLLRLADGRFDGAVSEHGDVWGTYLHGIFDNPSFTNHWLNHLRRKKGLPERMEHLRSRKELREEVYIFLAGWIRQHLDMKRINDLLGLPGLAADQ